MARSRVWLRITGLAIVACVLIWAPFEDVDFRGVLLLSAAICGWFCFRLLPSLNPSESMWSLLGRHVLVGTLGGLALAPLAFLLMALKSGLHGHGTPDFTLEQVTAVLHLTPYLAAAGFLIGLGSGLWRGSIREAAEGRD